MVGSRALACRLWANYFEWAYCDPMERQAPAQHFNTSFPRLLRPRSWLCGRQLRINRPHVTLPQKSQSHLSFTPGLSPVSATQENWETVSTVSQFGRGSNFSRINGVNVLTKEQTVKTVPRLTLPYQRAKARCE